MKLYNTSNICQYLVHLSWWSTVVVECKARYLRVTSSTPLHISTSLFLKLCPTITPPSPSTSIKKPKNQWRPLPSLLSLNSSMEMANYSLFFYDSGVAESHPGADPVLSQASSHSFILQFLTFEVCWRGRVLVGILPAEFHIPWLLSLILKSVNFTNLSSRKCFWNSMVLCENINGMSKIAVIIQCLPYLCRTGANYHMLGKFGLRNKKVYSKRHERKIYHTTRLSMQ